MKFKEKLIKKIKKKIIYVNIMAEVDIWRLYRIMFQSRLFENAVKDLW